MAVDGSIVHPGHEELTLRADVRVAQLAARQYGVLTAGELEACGLSPQAIAYRVRIGRLHPMHRSVYAVGHPNPTRDGWMLAAVKACGAGAVLCRHSAGAHVEIIGWEDRYPDVLVPGHSVPRHPRINGHRTSYLPREHVTIVRGVPCTTAERTLLDLAAVLPERKLRRAVRKAQFLKLTTVGSLLTVLHGPGPTRGRKKLTRILATGAAPTQSETEDAVLDLVLRGGFAHPSVNEPLFLDGRRIIPDLRWPRQRLVIEADGPHHDDPLERAADRERQAILEAHGDRVLRVTWKQAVGNPQATLRRIGEAGAPRGVG